LVSEKEKTGLDTNSLSTDDFQLKKKSINVGYREGSAKIIGNLFQKVAPSKVQL